MLLADDLSNQSLFGFKRSLRLKQIALEFCARIGTALKIVHVDDPQIHHYQVPLYKNYLDHGKLNQKTRYEKSSLGSEIKVEYQLKEGEAIQTLAGILEKAPSVGIIAGTSNRYGLGRLRIGSRIKRLVTSTHHPVFIFGLKAIRNYHYSSADDFRILAVCDSRLLTERQIKTLKHLVQLFHAKLKIVVDEKPLSFSQRVYLGWRKWRRYPLQTLDLQQIRERLPAAEVLTLGNSSFKKNFFAEIRTAFPSVIAVPESFGLSPFYVARRGSIPVVPLRDL